MLIEIGLASCKPYIGYDKNMELRTTLQKKSLGSSKNDMEVLTRIRQFKSTYSKYLTNSRVINRWYDKYTLFSIIQKCIYQICSYFDFMESYLYSYRHSKRLIHPSSYCIWEIMMEKGEPYLQYIIHDCKSYS